MDTKALPSWFTSLPPAVQRQMSEYLQNTRQQLEEMEERAKTQLDIIGKRNDEITRLRAEIERLSRTAPRIPRDLGEMYAELDEWYLLAGLLIARIRGIGVRYGGQAEETTQVRVQP